ncbi:MAG TPA: cytochrome c peroxidase [Polyangiales bacterium]|nr:cytochrome c peroxidase [Polyangiales bacterium]
MTRTYLLALLLCLPAGCADEPARVAAQEQPLHKPSAALGKLLFERPLPHTNGRACATCHVLEEATTLRPASVLERLRKDPDDPLFDRLDADDPAARELSFEHLKKGLIRVVLPLPDNMDVIDFEGQVITPPDRTIFVWRGVPSVADTALTAPYQMDGREDSLEHQAQGAITNHSQGRKAASFELESIAEFQRGLFSSPRGKLVAQIHSYGVADAKIPIPEDFFPLTDAQERGRKVYNAACQACHGGATTDRIVKPEIVDFLSPALTAEGNVRYEGQPPAPVRISRPGERFMNAGFGALTYVGQIGRAPTYNASLELPHYRFRFYRDATRSEAIVDLPPVPVTASGDPHDLRPARDDHGAPIVGPNLIPQQFTTDPGRAAITGNPADFEAFDTPQLRGIAQTAPYFHDNSRETLREVVDEYSRFLLPFLTPLGLPTLPPEQPGGRKEALSPEQKDDLLEFLEVL